MTQDARHKPPDVGCGLAHVVAFTADSEIDHRQPSADSCSLEAWSLKPLTLLIVNDTPVFRADHVPYGGNRQSELGREGVKSAMGEMTNIQLVAIRKAS